MDLVCQRERVWASAGVRIAFVCVLNCRSKVSSFPNNVEHITKQIWQMRGAQMCWHQRKAIKETIMRAYILIVRSILFVSDNDNNDLLEVRGYLAFDGLLANLQFPGKRAHALTLTNPIMMMMSTSKTRNIKANSVRRVFNEAFFQRKN